MPYKDPIKKREHHKLYMRGYEKALRTERKKLNNEYKTRMRAWFLEYKSTHPCIQCGEAHPACLDFHHRNPSEKDINLGEIFIHGWGLPRILAELGKCDVLCSNCHRKLHWNERMATGEIA